MNDPYQNALIFLFQMALTIGLMFYLNTKRKGYEEILSKQERRILELECTLEWYCREEGHHH